MKEVKLENVEFRINDKNASPFQLTELYTKVGWNTQNQRTVEKTSRMLQQSIFYVTASFMGKIVGFGRILGDSYTAQILDIMTDPEYRRMGIASQVIRILLEEAEGKFLGIYLINGTGNSGFYERFGFTKANYATDQLMYLQPTSNK